MYMYVHMRQHVDTAPRALWQSIATLLSGAGGFYAVAQRWNVDVL